MKVEKFTEEEISKLKEKSFKLNANSTSATKVVDGDKFVVSKENGRYKAALVESNYDDSQLGLTIEEVLEQFDYRSDEF